MAGCQNRHKPNRSGVRHVRGLQPNRATDFRGPPLLASYLYFMLLTYVLHLINDELQPNLAVALRIFPVTVASGVSAEAHKNFAQIDECLKTGL